MVVLCSLSGWAQIQTLPQMPGERVDGDVALDRALTASPLTYNGKPFHAAMEIGTAGTAYSGRIEVWWVNATKYRMTVTSPNFSQTRIVNGDTIEDKDDGDFYPRWLEEFALAVMDPVPMAKNFRGLGQSVTLGGGQRSCLGRNDRTNGITDELTQGQVCFFGADPYVSHVSSFNNSMSFGNWQRFGKKQVARTYQTILFDRRLLAGTLAQLEELKHPDEEMFTAGSGTRKGLRTATMFVSTLKEESLLEKAPELQWPSVREGRTDGYMIVYARTDQTGQVRETAKYNSDNLVWRASE